MPTKDQLAGDLAAAKERIRELENDGTQLTTDLGAAQQKIRDLENGGTVVYKKERKLKQFKPEDDKIEDWIENAAACMSHIRTDREKVQIILDHVDKKLRTEINFSCNIRTCTVDQVFAVLRKFHKPTSSCVSVQQQLFTCKQQKSESLSDYMHKLMDLALDVRELNETLIPDLQKTVKEIFSEGVYDLSLRNDLRNLNVNQPGLDTADLLEHSNKFFSSTAGSSSSDKVCSSSDAASSEQGAAATYSEDLQSLIRKQQEELDELKKRLNSRGKDKICYYCNRPGHIEVKCFKKRDDERRNREQQRGIQETEDEGRRGRRTSYRGRGGYRQGHRGHGRRWRDGNYNQEASDMYDDHLNSE